MSSAFGLSGSKQQSTVTNRTVTAQDSVVAGDSSVLLNNSGEGNIYAAEGGGTVNVTDGGAFELVGDVVDKAAGLLGDVFNSTLGHISNSTADILEANRVQSQESALLAQENTNGLIKFAIGAAALVASIYLYKKAS